MAFHRFENIATHQIEIRFLYMGEVKDLHGHFLDFNAAKNELNGAYMYTWDNWITCCIAENKRLITTLAKGIIEKSSQIEYVKGDKKFYNV
jgi:hypothetical protein